MSEHTKIRQEIGDVAKATGEILMRDAIDPLKKRVEELEARVQNLEAKTEGALTWDGKKIEARRSGQDG